MKWRRRFGSSTRETSAPCATGQAVPLAKARPVFLFSAAALALALIGLVVAARTGAWRETLLWAAPAVALAGLAARSGRRLPVLAARLLGAAVVLYALGVLLLAGLDALHQTRLPKLASPLVTNPIEGREALKGWLVAEGQNIYPRPGGYPRLITLYPPLYYTVAATLSLATGPGLACGRLAAVSGLLLLVAALFALARRAAGGVWPGLLAGLGFFVLSEADYGFECKPDTLAFGLLLATAWAFAGAREAVRNRGRLLLAGTLLAGAVLAKQQTWPLAAGCVAYAVYTLPRRRDAAWLLLGLAGASLVAWPVCHGLFGPGLWEQVVAFPQRMTGLAANNSLDSALGRLGLYAARQGPLLAAYAVWLGVCLARRHLPLPDCLLLLFLPFFVRTLMWSGSDTNHFLFVSAVCVLGVASLAGQCLSGSPGARFAGVLALCALLPGLLTPAVPGLADVTPSLESRETVRRIRDTLAGIPGPVLMDAEGAYLFAGQPDFSRLRLYDAFETDMYDRLGLAPILDSVMAEDIRQRRVARFVDSQVFISQDLLSLLAVYYEPAERVDRYAFYKPRPESGIVAMPVADRVARRDGALSAQVVDARNARNWGRYIQPEDPTAPLVLVYEVVADAPMAEAYAGFCPRLTGPDQTFTVAATTEDGRDLGTARYAYGDFPPSGEGFANLSRLAFRPGTDRFRVVFTLTGAAELWLDPAHPLVLAAGLAAPAAPSVPGVADGLGGPP